MTQKRGHGRNRVELDPGIGGANPDFEKVIAIDEALTRLATDDSTAAELVKLRFFGDCPFRKQLR
jgi:hypothetical protein